MLRNYCIAVALTLAANVAFAQSIPALFQPRSTVVATATDSGYKGTYAHLVDSIFRNLDLSHPLPYTG